MSQRDDDRGSVVEGMYSHECCISCDNDVCVRK